MTRIATISAENVKCPAFRHDLSAVNVLIGPNYSFKTARLEAIRLGLLGYVPGLPKTNAGIFSLSCGSRMQVSLTMMYDTNISRAYSQKGNLVKAIETGTENFMVPDVLMDAGEYLRLSDRERVKYVFSLVAIGDVWTGERILKAIGQTPIDCDAAMIEKVILAKREIFNRLSESDHERHENDGPVQEWLESVLEDLRDRTKNTAAALARMEKYSQGAVELRAGENGSPANVDRLIKEKSGELQTLREQIAVSESKRKQWQRVESMRAELKRGLAEPDPASAIEATKKQIQEVPVETPHKRDSLRDLATKLGDAKTQAGVAQSALRRIESEFRLLNKQHEMDMKSPKCPHCHRGGKGFKEAIETHYRQTCDTLMAESEKATAELGRALKAATEFEMQYEDGLKADQAAHDNQLRLERLKAELDRLETMVRTRADWQKQLDSLTDIEAPEPTIIAAWIVKARELEAELLDLQNRQKRWVAAAHEAKRQAEAKAQADQTAAELLTLKAIVKSVEIIQAEMVKEAFGTILADVNRFTDGILLSPLAYHESEIGRWSGTNWIPHRSFSGTEQLISCAGISVALARQSPIRICLLDELGRLTIENKRKLIGRLVDLTGQGFIDQAVCVDVDGQAYRGIEGVNLIEV